MKSDRYEPRECEVCGRMYKPGKIDQRTCGSKECVHELRRRNSLRWQRENSVARREHRKKHREPKQDTIVAIGYADRQRAETLRMVGRIKVEL